MAETPNENPEGLLVTVGVVTCWVCFGCRVCGANENDGAVVTAADETAWEVCPGAAGGTVDGAASGAAPNEKDGPGVIVGKAVFCGVPNPKDNVCPVLAAVVVVANENPDVKEAAVVLVAVEGAPNENPELQVDAVAGVPKASPVEIWAGVVVVAPKLGNIDRGAVVLVAVKDGVTVVPTNKGNIGKNYEHIKTWQTIIKNKYEGRPDKLNITDDTRECGELVSSVVF